ncbi:MAG: DUF4956 domain-containing protein [Rhodothermales bacterium]
MPDQVPSLEEFLATQSIQIPTWGFALNLILTAVLATLLARFYVRFGKSLSNRKQFSGNFILIAMTTMLIISIVKASLALSLGLVGALSIVRFRSAIKEPEELAYLFLVIGLGLGFGADQRVITLVAFAMILAILWISNRARSQDAPANLYLTVSGNGQSRVPFGDLVNTLQANCAALELKRLDEDKEQIEAAFVVSFNNMAQLEQAKSSLYELNDSLHIALLNNTGLEGLH